MLVSQLEDSMRKIIRQRIDAGVLSGTVLARQTGFQQAHISNFLNRRRGLSVEGFDRMLEALGISVTDLILPAVSTGDSSREYDDVPIIDAAIAHRPDFAAREISDVLKFKRAFLRRVKDRTVGARGNWKRFVLIKADAENALAMYPRIVPGATLLMDRHYNSLEPYRRREPNIYAVLKGKSLLVRYVEGQSGHLLLRPANNTSPLLSIAVESGRSANDPIIGRICHIGAEV
jgi:transcriptional regulator with XRE-family HTH domain